MSNIIRQHLLFWILIVLNTLIFIMAFYNALSDQRLTIAAGWFVSGMFIAIISVWAKWWYIKNKKVKTILNPYFFSGSDFGGSFGCSFLVFFGFAMCDLPGIDNYNSD